MIVLGVRYRVRQFALALGASLTRETVDGLEQYLTPPQIDLFCSMSPIDQHHCLSVFRALQRVGESDAPLLQAALLHDVGKAEGRLQIWHRVIAVLAKAIAPALWERIGGQPGTWWYPLYVHKEHAGLGAEMARKAGCSAEVVWLIAHHEGQPAEPQTQKTQNRMLAALQAADRIN